MLQSSRCPRGQPFRLFANVAQSEDTPLQRRAIVALRRVATVSTSCNVTSVDRLERSEMSERSRGELVHHCGRSMWDRGKGYRCRCRRRRLVSARSLGIDVDAARSTGAGAFAASGTCPGPLSVPHAAMTTIIAGTLRIEAGRGPRTKVFESSKSLLRRRQTHTDSTVRPDPSVLSECNARAVSLSLARRQCSGFRASMPFTRLSRRSDTCHARA